MYACKGVASNLISLLNILHGDRSIIGTYDMGALDSLFYMCALLNHKSHVSVTCDLNLVGTIGPGINNIIQSKPSLSLGLIFCES